LQVDDELKKIKPKDPKLMTARQRAMFERKTDKEPSPGGEQLLALPSGKLVKSVQWDSVYIFTLS
jgi:INO80 complex subunit B